MTTLRKCTTCHTGKVGSWVVGSICTTCLLDGQVDPRPTDTVPEEDAPVNAFGEGEHDAGS